MKTLGRIILLIVGGCLIGLAVPNIIDAVKVLNAAHWNLIVADSNVWSNFATLVVQGFSALFGLVAVVAFIRGKGSFWLFIFSLVMIAGVVWYFVMAYKAGTLGDWKNILKIASGFILPIGYFVGNILVRL